MLKTPFRLVLTRSSENFQTGKGWFFFNKKIPFLPLIARLQCHSQKPTRRKLSKVASTQTTSKKKAMNGGGFETHKKQKGTWSESFFFQKKKSWGRGKNKYCISKRLVEDERRKKHKGLKKSPPFFFLSFHQPQDDTPSETIFFLLCFTLVHVHRQ